MLDDGDLQYVNGKVRRSNADFENIEEIIEDPVNDHRIEHAVGSTTAASTS